MSTAAIDGPTARARLPTDCVTPITLPCSAAPTLLDARLVSAGVERELPREKIPPPISSPSRPPACGPTKGTAKRLAGKEERADYHQPQFAESFYQLADQSALNDHGNDADVGEEVAVVMCVVTKAKHRVERERSRHDRKSDYEKKIDDEDETESWLFE